MDSFVIKRHTVRSRRRQRRPGDHLKWSMELFIDGKSDKKNFSFGDLFSFKKFPILDGIKKGVSKFEMVT